MDYRHNFGSGFGCFPYWICLNRPWLSEAILNFGQDESLPPYFSGGCIATVRIEEIERGSVQTSQTNYTGLSTALNRVLIREFDMIK